MYGDVLQSDIIRMLPGAYQKKQRNQQSNERKILPQSCETLISLSVRQFYQC